MKYSSFFPQKWMILNETLKVYIAHFTDLQGIMNDMFVTSMAYDLSITPVPKK